MYQKLRNQNQGFTIIEVMIVLAIAGLIMMIVFLAVPALQRSSDNNARNGDASRIATAVNECVVNRNGVTTACTSAEINGLAGTRAELTEDIEVSQNFTDGVTGSTSKAFVQFSAKCNPEGSESVDSTNARDFAVLFQIAASGNNTINRCISI